MAGRHLKYSPARAERILEALQLGHSRKIAAGQGPVAFTTFLRWLRVVPDFDMLVRQAEAQAEMAATQTIMQAAEAGEWQAAVWWLERRRPESWGRR